MCGIIGYTGHKPALAILMEGLSNLEYRGYDSAGVAVFEEGVIRTVKAKGRLSNLSEKCQALPPLNGTCGIGHTRWATHGEPSDINSHPHNGKNLTLVHNGIIENYLQIRDYLLDKGYTFVSQTDTEAAAKLVDYYYHGDPIEAIRKAIGRMRGSYAFGILFADFPGRIYAVRRDSPLLVACGEGENFIASDMPAVLAHTKRYYLLEENEIALLTPQGVTVYGADGQPVKKTLHTAQWDMEQAQKNGFPHFMLKEIFEQPEVLGKTVGHRIVNGLPNFAFDRLPATLLREVSQLYVVACGTAMHAGLVGKSVIETLARVPVEVDIASEFRYRDPILDPKGLFVVISQSGETADSLAALRLAKARGLRTLGIVNVAGSSIAREADYVIQTNAGPEIAVASTKAYSVQMAVLYLLAILCAWQKGQCDEARARQLTGQLQEAIGLTRNALEHNELCKRLSHQYRRVNDLFFLGRGLDFALSQEGSLKLKEISYIHCESYAAGELKHGTISLITDGVPVVAIAAQEALLEKMCSNIKEVRARGAAVLLLCKEGMEIDPDIYDDCLALPAVEDLFMPFVTIIPLQLLAYHIACERGCDVDKPRNLAKSVTVE